MSIVLPQDPGNLERPAHQSLSAQEHLELLRWRRSTGKAHSWVCSIRLLLTVFNNSSFSHRINFVTPSFEVSSTTSSNSRYAIQKTRRKSSLTQPSEACDISTAFTKKFTEKLVRVTQVSSVFSMTTSSLSLPSDYEASQL